MCQGIRVEVTAQLYGICSCLPSSCGFGRSDFGWQAWGEHLSSEHMCAMAHPQCTYYVWLLDVVIISCTWRLCVRTHWITWEPPYGCWKLSHDPLQEQYIVFIALPSLQPHNMLSVENFLAYSLLCLWYNFKEKTECVYFYLLLCCIFVFLHLVDRVLLCGSNSSFLMWRNAEIVEEYPWIWLGIVFHS